MMAVIRRTSVLSAFCLFQLLNLQVNGQCSGFLNITVGDTAQYISSANFPGLYPSNQRVCEWRLTTEVNYTDILMHHNVKKLSAGDVVEIFPDCDYSSKHTVVHDSTTEDRLTDSNFASPVCIRFNVTSGTQNSGFQETFVAYPSTGNDTVCSPLDINSKVATTTPQYFYNQQFPALYSNNENCSWQITNGGTGKDIILTFEILSLEKTGNICLDYLNVKAGGETIGTTYCVTDVFITPFSRRNSSFWLEFHTDDADRYRGFVVSYVLEEPCKGKLNTLQARPHLSYLSSIEYPNNYQSAVKSGDYRCTWEIEPAVPEGLFLTIKVDKLSDGDTLFIYEGTSDGALLFPSPGDTHTDSCYFCNKSATFALTSSVYVEFNVSSGGNEGFNLGYLAIASSTNTAACAASAESPHVLEANDILQFFTYFNNSYPDSDCYWNISDGPTGRGVILTVEFAYFGTSCMDYLVITGQESTQTIVCSDTLNFSPVVIRNSSFHIKFNSSQITREHGFSISYILDAPCKGEVTMIKAELPITTITSPGYPSSYPGVGRSGGYVCKWHIEADTNTTGIIIKYSFESIQLGDTLALYEGCDSTGVEKYKSKSNNRHTRESSTKSFKGSAYVEFSVTSASGDLGLKMQITSQQASDNTEACGSNGKTVVATKEVQYFTSSNFPESYQVNENCQWMISAGNSGEIVILTVEFYDIEKASTCSYDYLLITGLNTTDDKICGTDFSHPLRTYNDTSFNVSFKSDGAENKKGFVFSVVLDKPCTSNTPTMLTADINVKNISSVDYTWNRQTGNYSCEWHIEASDGSAGILLYLDSGGQRSGTNINIYQGCDKTGTRLYPTSDVDLTMGSSPEQLEIAAGNSTFIEYSVGSPGSQGFQIQYLSIAASDNTAVCASAVSSPVTLDANDALQFLTSSNFPNAYPSSLQCYWNITDGDTGRGVILTVEFNHFADSCEDYIMISGGLDASGTKVCSNTFDTSPMVFKNSSFQLKFNSDAFNNASGFVISYILDAPCKGEVTMIKAELPITTITSPGYPSSYPGVGRSGGYVCKWHIEADTNTTGIIIKYSFESIQLGDTLALYEGCDSTGVEKFKSKSNNRHTRESSTKSFKGSAYVEFSVTSASGDLGLKMQITSQQASDNTEACGSNGKTVVATKEVQYFTSSNFPESYQVNENCQWMISAGNSGEIVILTVEFYDIEKASTCSYDYLLITGLNTTEDKICGTDFSHPLRTYNDTSFNVSFKSDGAENKKGFVFSVVLDKPCTSNTPTMLTADINVKNISSVDYTWNRQTGNYSCAWHIEASDGTAGILLYLDSGGQSSGTNINIYQGCDKTGTRLYPTSDVDLTMGSSPEQLEIAAGNSTFIEYSVGSPGSQGFQIQYLSIAASDNTAVCASAVSSPVTLDANDALQFLTSSNFPNAYPSSLQCYWNITDGDTGRGVILTVEFNHFADSCEDYIMISGGLDASGTKVCSNTFDTSPMVFKNSSFQLKFNSDAFNNASGFVISYILDAPCKGEVTMIKAELPITTITSPGYPSSYPGVGRSGGYVCKWHIEADTNTTGIIIKYSFESIQLGDTLALYEGCDSTGVEKFKSKSNNRHTRESSTKSFKGSAYVEFSVTSASGDLGLKMQITSQQASDNTEACGSNGKTVVATKEVQYFTSSNFPESYQVNENCQWMISAGNSGEIVILTVEFYDIEKASTCSYDYLLITGLNTTEDKICGTDFSHPLRTYNDTSFNVSFKSDGAENKKGFVFSVVLDKPCTSNTPTMLTADINVKNISSVDYTWNRQTGNYSCAWHIEASDGTAGILLYLDSGGQSSGTNINIYQGCDKTGTRLYPTSDVDLTMGSSPEQLEIAAGNSTFIEYSVGSPGSQGFQIQYLSIAASDNTAVCASAVSSPVTLDANDALQFLTSSNFPNAYPSSLQCYWNITDGDTGRGVILTVEFNHFADSCEDYIMISGGLDASGTKVCSNTFDTSPMVFKNSSFQLKFNSDAFNNASGFVISYILDAPCKGEVTMIKAELPITTITSPGYPSSYPGVGRSGGYVCKWHIEADTNTTGIIIKYSFESIQLGDTLALYEGCDSTGVEKYKSKSNNRHTRESSTKSFKGSAYVEFSVTSASGDLGLKMQITSQQASDNTEACGSNGKTVVATKEVQYFTSSNFPESYQVNENCQWMISAGNSGEIVILTVEFYDIEKDSTCSYDYLLITGLNTTDDKICGTDFSHPLRTYNDTSFNVSFKSDGADNKKGFVFSVVLDKPCTSNTPTMLTADIDVKSISSEDYPNNYTWNRQTGNYTCQWHIEATDGSAGILLDFEMGGLSINTYVNIHEGCDKTGTNLYPEENAAPVTIAERIQIATGNSTFIEFIVESAGGQGFRINYLSIASSDNSQACSDNAGVTLVATDSLQYITSNNFPQLYSSNLMCKWRINDAGSGRGVFLKLHLNHIECTNDKLELRDASGTTTTKCSDTLITSPENFTSESFVLDFISNAAIQKHGFVLSYILGPPCNGSQVRLVARENIQEFSSPFYPNNYPSAIPIGSYQCIWLIESSDNVANLLLAIEIKNLTAGNSLEMFQGTISGTKLFPENSVDLTLAVGANFEVAPGKVVIARFSVTNSESSGFIIKYVEQRPIDTTQACSATNLQITATSSPAYLTSPNFPDLYPNNQKCTWSINDGGSYRGVILQLLMYAIHNSTNCQNDELTIRAGPTREEMKFCSDTLETSTQNFTDTSFEIYFKTDTTINKRGFQLRHILGAPCNDSVIELNAISELQQLVSPEYPAYPGTLYSGPYTCYFVITPQNSADGNLMSFNLSGIDAVDNVVIYDGINNSGTRLYPITRRKRSTGITNQVLVRNSGSSAFIEFSVKSPTGSTGFTVDYVSHPVTNNTAACNSSMSQLVATSTIQYITSNNFPAVYPSNENCTWQISDGNSGIRIMFTLITYQIQEQGLACDGDKLVIQQGQGGSPNVRCSNSLVLTPEVFKSSSFDVQFLSDNTTNTNEHGFLFSYILDIPCQGGPTQLSADVQLRNFTSPEYPSNYPSTAFIGNYTCSWLIQTQESGAGILLLLNMDGLNAGDTLLVYSGTNNTGTRLYPTIINMQDNTSSSTFHFAPGSSSFVSFTATTTANKGFSFVYMAIKPSNTTFACSDNAIHPLLATSSIQYLTSPNFPDMYTSGLACNWTISRGFVNADVILTVRVLHTESDVCTNDTLIIKGEGVDAINLCSEQVSTTGIEYRYRSYDIQFITNNGDNNRGFLISYVLGPEQPNLPPVYTRSEKIAIAIAASAGPAVFFLVLATVTVSFCLRRSMNLRQPKPIRHTNGSFMNGQVSRTNGHLNFDYVKTERETGPSWVNMFKTLPSSPYVRYELPQSNAAT